MCSQKYRPGFDNQATRRFVYPALLFILVLFACLLGIWSRPAGFLANIWPANALMLGFLLRVPAAANWKCWLAGALAFISADLLADATLFKAVLLNSANLVSIGAAYLYLHRLPQPVLQLRLPIAMLHIAIAALLGGAAAGAVGAIANPLLFNDRAFTGFVFWLITEAVNYVAIMPILLSAPAWQAIKAWHSTHQWACRQYDILPALSVVISCLLAMLISGEGAIAFPVLPLLWCGLVYPIFPTAILTALSSLFAMLFIFDGQFASYAESANEIALISVRTGISMIATAPILLAIITQARNELLAELRHINTHDALTGVGNRTAFYQHAGQILTDVTRPHAVMMIDLDHFKSINDNYGHAAGDTVLSELAKRINHCLRPVDHLGRIGGEEFAVILQNCEPQTAHDIAERIRAAVARDNIAINNSISLHITASIGLTFASRQSGKSIDALLAEADRALYLSKANGRNRVECA